jgi:soluble lytic murein transglycosylase-like protein
MSTPYAPEHAAIRVKIIAVANKYGLNPRVAIAQLWQESRFKNTATSKVGACGIAQFMPPTAKEWKVNCRDIDSSLDGYGRYMAWLLKQFGGDYAKALAAYNGGIGLMKKRQTIARMPKESRDYVRIILSNAGLTGDDDSERLGKTKSRLPDGAGNPVSGKMSVLPIYLLPLGAVALVVLLLSVN